MDKPVLDKLRAYEARPAGSRGTDRSKDPAHAQFTRQWDAVCAFERIRPGEEMRRLVALMDSGRITRPEYDALSLQVAPALQARNPGDQGAAATADPYLIPGTDILRNKPGLTDPEALAQYEYGQSREAAIKLWASVKPVPPQMRHWCLIHRALFRNVYDWAGRIRTVFLQKSTTLFCAPQFIEAEAGKHLRALHRGANDLLARGDRDALARHLALTFGELNAVHPFREGNGRSQKLLFSLALRELNIELDWTVVPVDENDPAAIGAYHGDPSLLIRHFEQMITLRPSPGRVALRFPPPPPPGG